MRVSAFIDGFNLYQLREFIKALRARGVEPALGPFKEKDRNCRNRRRASCITGRRPLMLLLNGYTVPLSNGCHPSMGIRPPNRRRLRGSFPYHSLAAGQDPHGDALGARAGVVG